MKTPIRIALAAAALAALPAAAAATGACASDPAAAGLQARVENMQEKMDRIRLATDPAEQRSLMVLHDKLMREAMHEMRRRNTSLACRVELTDAMMDQLMLHQQVAHEGDGY
ncbi:MAG TPA: hypothetical protein VLS49_09245 [Usitatibacter sp.]|nr:hypothetical protein [Usitatibacter sp.]